MLIAASRMFLLRWRRCWLSTSYACCHGFLSGKRVELTADAPISWWSFVSRSTS